MICIPSWRQWAITRGNGFLGGSQEPVVAAKRQKEELLAKRQEEKLVKRQGEDPAKRQEEELAKRQEEDPAKRHSFVTIPSGRLPYLIG